ncbi:hypothetical protein [Intestinirhabdus alba]|jgi:hypothetical protein|uniref:Uncharacterized protein n=1 Tax=Intestinirhabdus alba TaxID=2899544 RepID=A0A6L6IHJ1_9ENTR|nr:hypothetical protein [Intestinirhabdus alba]MTH46059.1 hypothetical protein [Intestinirhabdus alba]
MTNLLRKNKTPYMYHGGRAGKFDLEHCFAEAEKGFVTLVSGVVHGVKE